jgi:hypothetical protein
VAGVGVELAWSWFGAGAGLSSLGAGLGLVLGSFGGELTRGRGSKAETSLRAAVVSLRARSPPHLGRDLPRFRRISLHLPRSPPRLGRDLPRSRRISLAGVVSCPVLDSDHAHPTQRRSRRERLRDRGGRWIDMGR